MQPRNREGKLIVAKTRILIMDDEDLILDVVSSMLEYLGYEVELSRNGQEALEIYKTSLGTPNPIGAVIMDLTIPGGRGGKEVIRDLMALDPQVRAIVSSGYSNDPIMSNCTEYGFKGVVRKPFKMEDLRDVLQEVLKT
ncbi:MAG TPA: response regulator [Deltaproteobacteria bacterium]|jgi:CheY-like chemotaxis protein|nr:MAG: Chemotaxis protein CheY [Deltaproteobacteria bacterium ADurb.Bin072]HNS88627.1 response regulator [Deltaproteobacteria bacterium]HPO32948.1 response regulator [Deltaproteobacteria bacterium]HQO60964.1 response regulator [Deltaproteobacteria bacterium]